MARGSASPKVKVSPALLDWALQRRGVGEKDAARKFAKFGAWKAGEAAPTLQELEAFARFSYTPVGFFFLRAPPDEVVPIPDFRTIARTAARRPSANLLDTVYICQQRQEWYRDHARLNGEEPLGFVGSLRTTNSVVNAAAKMRDQLQFSLEERKAAPTWAEALRQFAVLAEAQGVLVMTNSIVGTNTRRRLDPAEFRGFALSDSLAPLIFINGADAKAAQMFTMAHELAHLWLGKSALTDSQAAQEPDHEVERWCNRVAAELLVPLDVLRAQFDGARVLEEEVDRLAKRYKVSTLVVLRRALDAGFVGGRAFSKAYHVEVEKARVRRPSGGGDFYRLQERRIGRRFAGAIVASTLEGHTLYREAFRLTGISNEKSFSRFAQNLGVG